MTERPLPVLVGPTAAGKSGVAIALADARGLAIISADSRQVYRGFDIGTAKPTAADRARIPHYGLDVLPATQRYSAHTWATDAERWMLTATAAGTAPVIVGGTGFYVRALVAPMNASPVLDPGPRAALEAWMRTLDAAEIARWCRRLDPARAHLGRTQHQRAVETALLAGVRLSEALRPPTKTDKATEPSAGAGAMVRPVRYLVVDPGPSLAERIRARVQAMVDAGWFAEVEQLMRTIPPDAPAWNASGYGTIRAALEGTVTREAAIERVVIETRQYAKRQRTWNRHQLDQSLVTLLDPTTPDAVSRALAWWDAGDETRA